MDLARLEKALQLTLPTARLEARELPHCAGIRLALINPDFPDGPLPPEIMHAVIERPAYWAFCWGSGLALARFLIRNRSWVAGKSAVDLGSGSGIVGIAACVAGATDVVACDSDANARTATVVNAALNGTTVRVTDRLPGRCDILLMADVLYDRQNLPLLSVAQAHADAVLVADSRVTELPDESYREVARVDARTYPNLGEFDGFDTAHIFHWSRGGGGKRVTTC